MKILMLLLLLPSSLWAISYEPGGPVSKASYELIIDNAQKMFGPYLELLGHQFQIDKNWESTEIMSYTTYDQYPLRFRIVLSGGAYRNKETTNDGFAYTVCHEIAHIIGGSPKYVNEDFWGSAEGQADYMATNICLKNLFKNDSNIELVKTMAIPPTVTEQCGKTFRSEEDSALCQRSIMAGLSFAQNYRQYKMSSYTRNRNTTVYRQIAAPLSFVKRDSTIVRTLNRSYSTPQCRLDSAVAGALCVRGSDFHLNALNDPNLFNCEGNDDSKSHRPKCWFI